MSSALRCFDFEVFGRVQGVFFRKHTQLKAAQLGVTGWVRNTERNTVEGSACGPHEAMDAFRHFLTYEGSPKSVIERTVITNERDVETSPFEDFVIVRSPTSRAK